MDTLRQYRKPFFTLIFALLALTAAFSQSSRPIVSDISAYASSANKITLSWSLPARTQGSFISSLAVYRDTKPITDIEYLKKLTPRAKLPFGSVTYTDTVTDFLEYYYAVLTITKPGDYSSDNELYWDEQLDAPVKEGEELPYFLLLPGVNATIEGVKVQRRDAEPSIITKTPEAKNENPGELREQPLPFIDILGETTASESTISEEAEQNALKLIKNKAEAAKTKILEPYVFEEDLISPSGGDEYLLFEVLRTTFIQRKYEQSAKQLLKFLGINRNKQVTQRAKFYLGESYYYSGRFDQAMLEFMDLEEAYPSLSRQWIDSCLDLYSEDI